MSSDAGDEARSAEVLRLERLVEELQRHVTELESRHLQSEKMASLGQLMAGIAHEINTPVGAINSMQDTLSRALEVLDRELDLTLPESQRPNKLKRSLKALHQASSLIASASGRVADITKRLRSFARLDETDLQSVDVHRALEDTLVLIHHELKHRIELEKDFGEGVPELTCFPGRLNQVFLNLLNNAHQAIEGNGKITLRTRVVEGYLHVTVEDSGKGISEEHLKKVFEPGFTTKAEGMGTGLGLAISAQIAEAHRGRIEVSSEVGKGSAFTVVLPLDLAERLARESRPPLEDAPLS